MGCSNTKNDNEDLLKISTQYSDNQNSLLKFVIIGDSGVGKTSLMHRYVKDRVSMDYKTTIGADFLTKNIDLNGKQISLQIWDTAGQERFASLAKAFFRGADACLLVFSVTDHDSFVHLDKWKNEFLKQSAPTNPQSFPFILVGNKVDSEERLVSSEEAKKWSKENNIAEYFETSALDSQNVEKCFLFAATKSFQLK
eukprot:TRINITY_DN3571_c0_g1_i2.p1 TRINITY_DN3571_c0_g1~~TRINITY_DN3571_c0_g1_i2.p1  ORF type:complete len:197 (+),score=42.94 TRINITY_DN3571_c0_g1_i2:21-611(+)